MTIGWLRLSVSIHTSGRIMWEKDLERWQGWHTSAVTVAGSWIHAHNLELKNVLYIQVLQREQLFQPNALAPNPPRRTKQIIMTLSATLPLGFWAAPAATLPSSHLLSASAPPSPSFFAFASSTAWSSSRKGRKGCWPPPMRRERRNWDRCASGGWRV